MHGLHRYYQNASDPLLNHPAFLSECAKVSQQAFGDKLGVGIGAYETAQKASDGHALDLLQVRPPLRFASSHDCWSKNHIWFRFALSERVFCLQVLKSLDSMEVPELDLFAIDSRRGRLCKTCAKGWPGCVVQSVVRCHGC